MHAYIVVAFTDIHLVEYPSSGPVFPSGSYLGWGMGGGGDTSSNKAGCRNVIPSQHCWATAILLNECFEKGCLLICAIGVCLREIHHHSQSAPTRRPFGKDSCF